MQHRSSDGPSPSACRCGWSARLSERGRGEAEAGQGVSGGGGGGREPAPSGGAPAATVLFAGAQNAGRSQMAAAFFNALADPAVARAVSAGTAPAARVHPEVVEAMRESGLDLSAETFRLLTSELAGSAALLVTLGCGAALPVLPGLAREDWPLADPGGQPLARVREIRDEIRARVHALVAAHGWVGVA